MTTAASRYTELETLRQPYLTRAISCAELTLPYLLPPMGYTGSMPLPTPNQSLGARGVDNLSARLLLTMFPPNTSFFKYTITDADIEKLTDRDNLKTEFDKAFAALERNVTQEIEARAYRPGLDESLKHLIVSGNVLVNFGLRKDVRVFSLHKYVVDRDGQGNVREIVVKEMVSKQTLIDRQMTPPMDVAGDTKSSDPDKDVPVYTWIKLVGKKWLIHQEAWNQIVPGSQGTEPMDKPTWLALRLFRVDGENYGRGYVERLYGDLSSYDQLSKVTLEAFGVLSKINPLVNPTGTIKTKHLAEAKNGEPIYGREGDISYVTSGQKINEVAAVAQYAEKLANDLKYSFLMNSAVQRPGERVTAEEIRIMAQELDNTMGGVYVLLSQELQLPLVSILTSTMQKEGRLPKLPSNAIRPSIVTGIEALGRGNDLQKLSGFMEDIARMANVPESILMRLNMGDLIKRAAIGRGIDTVGLIRDEAEVQQEIQQQQQMQAMMQMAPNLINAGGKIAADSMKQGQ